MPKGPRAVAAVVVLAVVLLGPSGIVLGATPGTGAHVAPPGTRPGVALAALGISTRAAGGISTRAAGGISTAAPAAFPPRAADKSSGADPAPMGLDDYGITANGTTSYNSTSFVATASIASLTTEGNLTVGPYLTFQMNLNLEFEDGGTTYVFWIQNVAWVDTADRSVFEFENNIWNFSSPAETIYSSTVRGNGAVHTPGYYAFGTLVAPAIDYPASFRMELNASVDGAGQPVVTFAYAGAKGFVTYDTVTFVFAHALDSSQGFVVDGSEFNPTGYLYYDAEFVLGGPGDGYSTTDTGSSVDLNLAYWNGHNYETVNDAKNYGYDTAETIADAVSTAITSSTNGSLYAKVTSGTEATGVLWEVSDIARVEVVGPAACAATLYAGNAVLGYRGGGAWYALGSTSLDFEIGCAGYELDLGAYDPAAGAVTVLNAGTWADLEFTSTNLTSGTSWGIAIGADTRSGAAGALTFYLPTGSYGYAVTGGSGFLPTPTDGTAVVAGSGGRVAIDWEQVRVTATPGSGAVDVGGAASFAVDLDPAVPGVTYLWLGLPYGCTPTNASSIGCTPSAPGAFTVTVTVSEPGGFSSSSGGVSFMVFADPTVSKIVAAPTTIDLGGSVNLSATVAGGSGGYAYDWSDLPVGCTASHARALTCQPQAVGAVTVELTVTDSLGGRATGEVEFSVVDDPAVESLAASPGALLEGSTLTINVAAVGGVGPYSYAYSGLPAGCSSTDAPQLRCAPSSSGSFRIEVTVVDANGYRAYANVSVQVGATFLGLPAVEGAAVAVGAAGIAAVGLAAALIVRHRSRRGSGPP